MFKNSTLYPRSYISFDLYSSFEKSICVIKFETLLFKALISPSNPLEIIFLECSNSTINFTASNIYKTSNFIFIY